MLWSIPETKELKHLRMVASRSRTLGWGRDCYFLLQALSFCLTSFRSNGVILQRSPQQPGSPKPSLPAHPLRQNGKQQRFPHKGAWSGCHSPLPPEPKSSGFPVSPRAVWSMMRYCAGLLDCMFSPSSITYVG